MLRIDNIRKKYVTGELVQTALDGVSLNLRENEFVAILGPSGSGKTTLLNVIGGLDRYDSGDLIIDGVSTKKYSDRDWDSYRNHTIGFVFQSYNLIPHQTVLANVELALTISGISRAERRRRAVKALEDVGLGNQLHKKPNQMSGGQMQRVAIARALVNNPSVLLADEPTGALDSETSIQVMELLKRVSKDRLVVMVTHNPELAVEYASRIVRVKDGKIIDDSDPYKIDESVLEPPVHRNLGKASMSFGSALSLSFNNLRTKKARTFLTAFAGSIGIIGIALIMALSNGFQNYIDKIQADTLANYPLMIQSETADMSAGLAMMGLGGTQQTAVEPETVSEQPMISKMFASIGSNDLSSFRSHLENNWDSIGHTLNAVQYGYDISPRIFSSNPNEIRQVNPETLFTKLTGSSAMSAYMQMDSFQEMIDNPSLLNAQYQVLEGRWPQSYDELVFILPDENKLPDFAAYILGLKPIDGVDQMIHDVMNGKEVEFAGQQMQWTYGELMAMTFRLVSTPDLYRYNEQYDVWEDMSGDEQYMRDLIDQGELLKVVGIICPQEGVTSTSLMPGIGYLPSLTQHVMDSAKDAEIVKQQQEHPEKDVFSGKNFNAEESDRTLNFEDMIHVDGNALSSAFGMNVNESEILTLMQNYLKNTIGSLQIDTSKAQNDYLSMLADFSNKMLQSYVTENADADGCAKIYLIDADSMTDRFLSTEYAQDRMAALSKEYGLPKDTLMQVTKPLMVGLVTGYVAQEISNEVVPEEPSEQTPPSESPEDAEASQPTAQSSNPPVETTDESVPSPEQTPETAPQPTESITAPTEVPSAPTEIPPRPSLPEVPDASLPELPNVTVPPITPEKICTELRSDQIPSIVEEFLRHPVTVGTAAVLGQKMMEPTLMAQVADKMASFGKILGSYLGQSFYVNEEKLSNAIQFNMNEDELRRLMEAMSARAQERTAENNLRMLGYASEDNPTSMAIYMSDFSAKEEFLRFIDDYNSKMSESGHEEKEIQYMDVTGMMMSSVKTIIDSVSYVLIAFVAVSLIVSSIMIGIITYISVMERTKEIGVLRAMGASKHNISQVFNAETYIIGLCSGLLGVGITLALLFPINHLIRSLSNNPDIIAQLPVTGGVVLVLLSMFLTVLGGLIPSHQAAKKDPVIALRTE